MNTRRRTLLAGLTAPLLPRLALAADDFPAHPIRIIVGVSPGGIVDIATRRVAAIASQYLGGVAMVIENRIGAMGTIGLKQALDAKPDGYTLASVSTTPVIIAPLTMDKPPYDPVKDVQYLVNFLGPSQALLVKADSRYKTLDDLVEDAKAHPGAIAYGTYGVADAGGYGVRVLGRTRHVRFNQIPYQGSSQQMLALLSGEVQFTVTSNYMKDIRNGRLRALALLDKQRYAALPDVPTFKELGIDFEFPWITGLATAKGMPEQRLRKLEAAFLKAAESDEFKAFLAQQDVPPYVLGGSAMQKQISEDVQAYKGLVHEFGATQ
jgi:tripartite-type tricarboxylate transporter receptor subunit TctC